MNIKRIITSFVLTFGVVFAVAAPVVYAGTDVFEEACRNGSAGNSAVCDDVSTANPVARKNGVLFRVVRIVSIIAGIAAVIMMMVGGFMYITSNGDAGKATTGRNTIIYAVVGLLIIALGQAIITLFVNTTPE